MENRNEFIRKYGIQTKKRISRGIDTWKSMGAVIEDVNSMCEEYGVKPYDIKLDVHIYEDDFELNMIVDIEKTEEEINNEIENEILAEKKRNEREYKQFLELKKQFEGGNEDA